MADGSGRVSRESDADLWRAARVASGAGSVTTVTLSVSCVHLARQRPPVAARRGVRPARRAAAENDHFEFYVFPPQRTALCRESKHTEEPPDPYGRVEGFLARRARELLLALLCGIGKRFPGRIPAINRLIPHPGRIVKTEPATASSPPVA